jgi:putative transposase
MRLPRFDYCRSGAYFITFCTAHRDPLLAEVDDGRVQLTAAGQIVAGTWPVVLERHPHVRLLESAVMPDHVHALLVFDPISTPRQSVCRVVGAVKTYSAARINRLRGTPAAPVWQPGFHDWIVRSPKTLARIRDISRTTLNAGSSRWARPTARQEIQEAHRYPCLHNAESPADEGSGGRSGTAPTVRRTSRPVAIDCRLRCMSRRLTLSRIHQWLGR